VKSFKFIGGKLSEENLLRFNETPILHSVTHLDFSDNIIFDQRMTPFLEGFNSKNLLKLNLRNCGCSYESLKHLFSNTHFSSLRDIDLSQNYDLDLFVRDLAKTQNLNKLRRLSLSNSYLDNDSLFELFSSENFSNITHFDISYNYLIKDDGLMLLCDKPFCRSLTHLRVAKCNLTIESLKFIGTVFFTLKFLADSKYLGN
jgi:hypothetical protein